MLVVSAAVICIAGAVICHAQCEGPFGSCPSQAQCPAYNGSWVWPSGPYVSNNAQHSTGAHTWWVQSTVTNNYLQVGAKQPNGWPCRCTATVAWTQNAVQETGNYTLYHDTGYGVNNEVGIVGNPGQDLFISGYAAFGLESCTTNDCAPVVTYAGPGNSWTYLWKWWGVNLWYFSIQSDDDCPAEWAGQQGSPLMIDASGRNFSGAFSEARDGTLFQLFPLQAPVRSSWPKPDSGAWILVMNRSLPTYTAEQRAQFGTNLPQEPFLPAPFPGNNWVPPNSRYLFGNFTSQRPRRDGNGKAIPANGFIALAMLDTNGDNVFDRNDQAWEWVRWWNGSMTSPKYRTMDEMGIASIPLYYEACPGDCTNPQGDEERYVGHVVTRNGTTMQISDWYLQAINP